MRLITKDIHYALKVLLYIVKDPLRITTVDELAKKLNMRRVFLRGVLQSLAKKGILKSFKGNRGGFRLNINPGKIHVIDVVNIFRKDEDIFSCLLDKDICPHLTNCVLMKEIIKANKGLNNILKKITILKLSKSINGQVKEG